MATEDTDPAELTTLWHVPAAFTTDKYHHLQPNTADSWLLEPWNGQNQFAHWEI
jgi:hypothetical protein